MFVGDTGHIFIEKHSPVYPHVIDFLVSCCEPVSRTQRMEQYRLDSSSLSAASAEGTYTTDMIRNILRYLRVEGDGGELRVDLRRLAALEAWAASPAAAADPSSYKTCLAALGGGGGGADPLSLEKPPAASPATAGGDAATTRRRLVLRPPAAATAAKEKKEEEEEEEAEEVGAAPLVALAAVERGWCPPPLPTPIEEMLAEEENASKMRIVLQPRLRRFLQQQDGSGPRGDAEQRLHYFVVSSDREQLERVVASEAREFLQPVVLHGSPRWILSDVERGVEEAQLGGEEGRPAALRRLYATGGSSCATPRRQRAQQQQQQQRLVYKTQVQKGKLRNVKEYLFRHFGIRADCFYDYLQDRSLHVDGLSLAKHVRLRAYQSASLDRFHRGHKAHQGVIVLPCGAGKTLTGIGAAALMQKRTIVMCINNMSVFQWQNEFLRWTNLTREQVTVCTAKEKAMPGPVFITTYSMLIAKRGDATGAAARESEEILKAVRGQTWGLLLLDEVHVAIAHHFQEVLNQLRYQCVLGLSATLLREDDRIADLRHLVGPKLYEANWLDLTRDGFLATVECAEVQCPMPAAFYAQYCSSLAGEEPARHRGGRRGARGDGDDSGDDDDTAGGAVGRKRRRGAPSGAITAVAHNMAASNPHKLWCTQALLDFHQRRSPPDKVIIFCDYLADVRFYAYNLNLPFMDQRTSEAERRNLLRYFQFSDTVNAIVLTRVGDVALDLPCASVVIQISGLGASRRQEAQRLGRILRPKPPSIDSACAYFYTLVSQDTHEVRESYGRQSWLRDQGFAYRVLSCDRVLAAFERIGGVRCCIGPPQWWYQVPAPTPATTAGRGAAPVARHGCWWVPFSRAASEVIHRAFRRGQPSCALEAAVLGADTPRPTAAELGGAAAAEGEWAVVFSSADAPTAFGTVAIACASEEAVGAVEGGGLSDGSAGALSPTGSTRVRRITFGQFSSPHNCLDAGGPCLGYALSHLGATVDDDKLDSNRNGDL